MAFHSPRHPRVILMTGLALWSLPACSDEPGSGRDGIGGAAGRSSAGASGSAGQAARGGIGSAGGSNLAGGGAGGTAAGSASPNGGSAPSGSSGTSSAAGAAAGAAARGDLAVVTDTNRDGAIDARDTSGLTDWVLKGGGAFFIANVDDDDENGKIDASDEIVNGQADQADLARIVIDVSPELLAKSSRTAVSLLAGAQHVHLFEKNESSWKLVKSALGQIAAHTELGIEATQFADPNWDGFATLKVELFGAAAEPLASQQVKMRVAPWIMLPNSAKTEILYISSQTSALKPDIDRVMTTKGLPASKASNPGNQDIWFQDTMEVGYTQLPGSAPLHVVMKAQRPNASDDLAPTLLGPDFGFISIGSPRTPADEEDHWMDWTGNLEVSHPVPGYPLGRIYYGHSSRTTFHPTIVEFLEVQGVQKPFTIDTEWLFIQHVDEIMNFVPDKDGKAKMYIVSPAAANAVVGSGYDAGNQQIQQYIEEDINIAKKELGLSDSDIVRLPVLFEGGGTNWAPKWSSPSNAVYVNGTLMIGETGTPAAVKTDIEQKLASVGVEVAWVDDSEYQPGGGNVHCGTNTAKTPVCAQFTQCLP